MTSRDAFELRGVVAGPVGTPILRGVDLVVPANGVTVLAGPSGAGKSTLLRLLNRLDDPIEGEVRWRDRPLTDWDPTELRREVAMVFQRAPVFPGTVLDNLRVASAEVSEEPLGRHSPVAKSPSDAAPPTTRVSRYRGWRCIGFQTGRASMSAASSAVRTSSRSVPAASGSMVSVVSHRLVDP